MILSVTNPRNPANFLISLKLEGVEPSDITDRAGEIVDFVAVDGDRAAAKPGLIAHIQNRQASDRIDRRSSRVLPAAGLLQAVVQVDGDVGHAGRRDLAADCDRGVLTQVLGGVVLRRDDLVAGGGGGRHGRGGDGEAAQRWVGCVAAAAGQPGAVMHLDRVTRAFLGHERVRDLHGHGEVEPGSP